jgi:hypothetical protein
VSTAERIGVEANVLKPVLLTPAVMERLDSTQVEAPRAVTPLRAAPVMRPPRKRRCGCGYGGCERRCSGRG